MYKYEVKKVSDLLPYVNNSRTHSEEQTTQIASSISEFGFTNPVLIDDTNNLIAGHGRLMAAKKLNLEEVPCITLEGLTEAQRKAYIIADNQLPLNAEWDLDKLKLEIDTLTELDFDIDLLSFDDDFLDDLLDVKPEEDNSDVCDDLSESMQNGFELIVECDSEMSLEERFSKAQQLGWSCRTSIL